MHRLSPSLPGESLSHETFLELAFVLVIIGLLTAYAADNVPVTVVKFRMLEAATLFATERADAVVYRANTGSLPDSVLRAKDTASRGRAFSSVQWHDGELVYSLSPDALGPVNGGASTAASKEALTLGFRVAVAPASSHLIWLCGTREPPAGFAAAPPRLTTVPDAFLPYFCRASTRNRND